jgi:hypothetical protein
MRNKQLTSSSNYSYLSTLKNAATNKYIYETSSFVFLLNLWARSDFGYGYTKIKKKKQFVWQHTYINFIGFYKEEENMSCVRLELRPKK